MSRQERLPAVRSTRQGRPRPDIHHAVDIPRVPHAPSRKPCLDLSGLPGPELEPRPHPARPLTVRSFNRRLDFRYMAPRGRSHLSTTASPRPSTSPRSDNSMPFTTPSRRRRPPEPLVLALLDLPGERLVAAAVVNGQVICSFMQRRAPSRVGTPNDRSASPAQARG